MLTVARRARYLRPRWSRTFQHTVLPSTLSTTSPEFKSKAQDMDTVVSEVQRLMAQAREGGGAKAKDKMRSNGKKTPRERLELPSYSFLCCKLIE